MLLLRLPQSSLPERRPTLGRMMSTSATVLLFATGALITLLALLILFNENRNATKGYRLRTLERERSQLLLTEEILKMRIAEAQALDTFQNDPKINAMVGADKPQYMRGDTAVAREHRLPARVDN